MEILIGKAVPPLLIGMVQSFIVLTIAVVWFKVALVGSLFTLALVMAVFLLSCVGIGLSISAVAKNMQQVIVYNFVVLLPIMLLSGMATPVRNMPTVLQYFTYINPMRFAIDGVRRVYIEGASLSMIASDFIPMLIVAAVTMPLAAWMFRHKLGYRNCNERKSEKRTPYGRAGNRRENHQMRGTAHCRERIRFRDKQGNMPGGRCESGGGQLPFWKP